MRAEAVKNRHFPHNPQTMGNQPYHPRARSHNNVTWTDHRNQQSLPPTARWANPQQNDNTRNTSAHPRHSHPHQVQYGARTNHNLQTSLYRDNLYNKIAINTKIITDTLYNGLQFPEIWLETYNKIMIHNGHLESPINIPADIIHNSKCKFHDSNQPHFYPAPPPPPTSHLSLSEFPPLSSQSSNPSALNNSPSSLPSHHSPSTIPLPPTSSITPPSPIEVLRNIYP